MRIRKIKLIIDIDEDVIVAISRMGLLRIPDEMQKKVDKAIQLGTPLNKIRAEILSLPTDVWNMVRRTRVLNIIDKHMAESEGKK